MATFCCWKLLVSLVILHSSFAFVPLEAIFDTSIQCRETCENTYAQHTYEKTLHLGYCKRGCRLYSIIDFINEQSPNNTRDSCNYSCLEAYKSNDDSAACVTGCNAQLQVTLETRKDFDLDDLQPSMDMMYPMLYVHNIYSNLIEHIHGHMHTSWSFFIQADNGKVIISQSAPRYVFEEHDPEYFKTSTHLETNLESVDNSATPDLKHSQVHAVERDMGAHRSVSGEEPATDWLACISKKTGLSRLVLTGILFLSAIVMIWLCLVTASTAPEQRVQSQKLSIYGDLDYLQGIQKHALLAGIHPQEKGGEAAPLPIKICVERI